MKNSDNQIFTIGHSNRNFDEFIQLLNEAEIQTVVDCRSKPRSRWYQYNQSILSASLDENGIKYESRGNNLGGLSGNVNFDETLNEICVRSQSGERIALMCSEGDPKKCHRGTVLTPELESRGIVVNHLLYVNSK